MKQSIEKISFNFRDPHTFGQYRRAQTPFEQEKLGINEWFTGLGSHSISTPALRLPLLAFHFKKNQYQHKIPPDQLQGSRIQDTISFAVRNRQQVVSSVSFLVGLHYLFVLLRNLHSSWN
jgi:hypothetical protein